MENKKIYLSGVEINKTEDIPPKVDSNSTHATVYITPEPELLEMYFFDPNEKDKASQHWKKHGKNVKKRF